MGLCQLCGKKNRDISSFLGVCKSCIIEKDEALEHIEKAHELSRTKFGLPKKPPKSEGGVRCNICGNECVIGDLDRGYCGLREKEKHFLTYTQDYANLQFYHDPLPTNCVADWVCAGGTGTGYPKHAYRKGPEYGYKNLAVFFCACSFNCLYCQNWHYRIETKKSIRVSKETLLEEIDDKTSCICFFGGDPSCQMPFAIAFSKLALKKSKNRILRICFETNGSMNPALLDEAFELCLRSGGCIKFDLKAYDKKIHRAITGMDNELTFANFISVAKRFSLRPEPPPVVASTLVVPGYVEEDEIAKIAGLIAEINDKIPYAILAFYPHFYMNDLPFVSRDLIMACFEAAKAQGLKNVRIGNVHLIKGS
ncbi:MAG: radical SAM protein [Desulfobacterota bacterium]|nr:radical SAM protein [Thermodesulfobacteriota bacterium]MDW8001499.1 radical SAM protein [Deltaproteobacteria bacterium]